MLQSARPRTQRGELYYGNVNRIIQQLVCISSGCHFVAQLYDTFSSHYLTCACLLKCDLLGQIFPDLVSTFKSPSYRQQQSEYWSNQQENTFPVCRIQPRIANHIAATLLVNDFFNCPFAVKSEGHSAFAGSSNIQNGITVDLTQIDEVAVSSDGLTTRIGAGNRWIDVYKTLTPMNLSVIGGRVGAIGVGGLTLGGGYNVSLNKDWY